MVGGAAVEAAATGVWCWRGGGAAAQRCSNGGRWHAASCVYIQLYRNTVYTLYIRMSFSKYTYIANYNCKFHSDFIRKPIHSSLSAAEGHLEQSAQRWPCPLKPTLSGLRAHHLLHQRRRRRADVVETAEPGGLRGRGDRRCGELPMLSSLARTAGPWLPPERPDPQPTPRPRQRCVSAPALGRTGYGDRSSTL